MTPTNLFRALRVVRSGALAMALVLPLGFGLVACKKKPSADKTQSDDKSKVSMDTVRPPMDAMKAMDGMQDMRISDGMAGMRIVNAMETPDPSPDAGAADPKGNKGMVPMKQLLDHTK